MNTYAPKSIQVSRETLYQQVWETPMIRLAAQYGITDSGLAKACRRLGVPYPNRGYWRKKETGKKVSMPRLPANKGRFPETTTITLMPKDPDPPTPSPEQEEQRADVLRLAREIDVHVPQRISSLHPVLSRWENRRLRKWRGAAPTPTQRRRYRLLQALFAALERRGAKIKWYDGEWRDSKWQRIEGQAFILIGSETILFEMREILRHEKRLLTEEERKSSPPNWRYRHEDIPTGRFVFSVTTGLPHGWVDSWKETEERPMEEFLAEIAATCILVRPELEKRRIAHEREERRKRIAAERARRAKRRRELDEKRWDSFVAAAKRWEKLRKARSYLEALRAENTDPNERIGKKDLHEWLAWAERRLSREETRYGRRSLFNWLAEMRLEDDSFVRRRYEYSQGRR